MSILEKINADKHNLAELVDYSEKSIISKNLIDKKAGSVTLFSFDKGQKLSTHQAPYDAMVYVVDGKAEITINGSALVLEAGETVIMPANQPHSVSAIEKFKMLLTMVKE